MCLNYAEGKCLAEDKACKLGDKGANAEQGACSLHGEYDVYHAKEDKIVVSNLGIAVENKAVFARGIDFLTADELAYKKSRRMKVPVDYVLKGKKWHIE